MLKPEPLSYFEYIIRDAESYRAVLSEANHTIYQIEPGCLRGRHVRFGLPGGQFSYVETNIALRGGGSFPNRWTLSVLLESTTQSLQHGVEVRAGSLVIHRPYAAHDGVYGRNCKFTCVTVNDDVMIKWLPKLHPRLQDAMREPCAVFEPSDSARQKTIEYFAEAAAIIQQDPRIRDSLSAVAKFEEELVCHFLEVIEEQLPTPSVEAEQRASAMVRQIDRYVENSPRVSASVADLCSLCEVPRRTLNRAFHDTLGMGPATYLRRLRLNGVHRALRRKNGGSITVTDVALEFGFWHLGRFAEQYKELFGESPHETLHRAHTEIGTASLGS
jgi:AraC family ethanolamine operon transcriptional activator